MKYQVWVMHDYALVSQYQTQVMQYQTQVMQY